MKLVQVALRATDLDRAAAFYGALLGTEPTGRFDPPGLVFFDLDGTRLLLDATAPSSMLYLEVDDVRRSLEALRDRVEVVSEPHPIFRHEDDVLGPAATTEWQAFVTDSEGNTLGLVSFAREHGLMILSVADLIRYRLLRERMVERTAEAELEVAEVGRFKLVTYRTTVDDLEHVALVKGQPLEDVPVLGRVGLVFRVAAGDEFVTVFTERGGQLDEIMGGAGSALYFLLTLARRRLADAGLPEDEQGWVHVDELAEAARCSVSALNQWVFRLRRRFAARGFDEGEVVERRARTGLLRIGWRDLRIEAG